MKVMYVTFLLGLLIPGYLCNDVANLVYIDASNGDIVLNGVVVDTQPTGVHGDIVHNAAIYFSVLDNFVQVTVPSQSNSFPVLNEVPGDVQDIAECCNRVFAVLSHGNGEYSIAVYYAFYTKIFFTFTGRVCAPKIAISCTQRMLYYTTDTGIFQWDFTDSDLNAPTELGSIGSDDFIANPTYGNCPFCLQYEEDGSSLPVLYFTLESSNRIYQMDSAGSFSIFQTISDRDEIRHLTADPTCLYYTSVTGTTHRVEYRPRASPATAATLVTDTVQASGISICENPSCAQTCPPLECSTCTAGCGACLPAAESTSGPCFCSNIFQESCTFASTSTFGVGCDVGLVPNDLICAVVNPAVGRRPPARDIIIHGVVGGTIQREFASAMYEVQISRRVKTGRWPGLPEDALGIQSTDLERKAGFAFHARPRSRGQRFGVFAARLVQTNGRDPGYVLTETLCMSQETSRITAPYYTITTSETSSDVPNTVELRAYIPPDRVRRIIWSHTDLATGFRTPRSAGQRSISFAATVANAGIYEAYIDLRYLRTWHAIFHVIVRGCDQFKYGTGCGQTCQNCASPMRGVCDEATGSCICLPGYGGDDCNTPCAPGMIGQNCDISCETEFGQPGCKDTLICSPYPVGCHCFQEVSSTGLQPPYCACPENAWGLNCENVCNCSDGFICDSMEGCRPDYLNI